MGILPVRGSTAKKVGRMVLTLWAVALLAGCASTQQYDFEALTDAERINDPAEPFNRGVFEFNRGLDDTLIRPLTGAYRAIAPRAVRRGVHNFLNNLRSPVILANDLMQGEWQRARTTAVRFIINSSVGILGFSDQAATMGFEFHNEDLGQTLAVWGVPEGPYTMLPIVGPSNPRDSFGRLVELFLDPLNFWSIITGRLYIVISRTLVRGIDARDRLLDVIIDIERSSLDPYATLRSIYRQRRNHQIKNGANPSQSEAR